MYVQHVLWLMICLQLLLLMITHDTQKVNSQCTVLPMPLRHRGFCRKAMVLCFDTTVNISAFYVLFTNKAFSNSSLRLC